jgi:hypothetical protein
VIITLLVVAYLLLGCLLHRNLIRDAYVIKYLPLSVNAAFYVLVWPLQLLAASLGSLLHH